MTVVILLWIAICTLGLIMVGASFHAAAVDYHLVRSLKINGLNQLVSSYIVRMEGLRLAKLLLLFGLGVTALVSGPAASIASTPVLFVVVALIVAQTVFDRQLRNDVRRLT